MFDLLNINSIKNIFQKPLHSFKEHCFIAFICLKQLTLMFSMLTSTSCELLAEHDPVPPTSGLSSTTTELGAR